MELIAALLRVSRSEPLCDSLRGLHLGVAGGTAFADAMRASTPAVLSSLDLYGCDLTDAGAEPLVHMLCERGGCTTLDLGANALVHACQLLSPLLLQRAHEVDDDDSYGCGGLLELRLSRNNLAGEAIGAMLTPPSMTSPKPLSLHSLALAFNPLGAAGGACLGRALAESRLPHLACLLLQGCQLGPTGVTMLVAGLERGRALTHLDLSDNASGDAGACTLAAVLPRTSLADVMLARNGLNDQAGQALAAALVRKRRSSLRQLVLASNRLRDASAIAFADALGAARPEGNRSLESLDLSGNKLRIEGVFALGDALVANGKLTALDLSRNRHVDAQALEAIEGLLRHNRRAAAGAPPPLPAVEPTEHARELASRDVLKLFTSEGLRAPPYGMLPPPPLPRALTAAAAPAEAFGRSPPGVARVGGAARHDCRTLPSTESLSVHTTVRQAGACASANTALREVQAALDDAGNEVARLRHKEATLMRALCVQREAKAL